MIHGDDDQPSWSRLETMDFDSVECMQDEPPKDSTSSRNDWNNDYWFGKALFEYQIKRTMFYISHGTQQNPDAAVESIMHHYPYKECLLTLRDVVDLDSSGSSKDEPTPYYSLMCLIGISCRIRGKHAEPKITDTLCKHMPEPAKINDTTHSKSNGPGPGTANEPVQQAMSFTSHIPSMPQPGLHLLPANPLQNVERESSSLFNSISEHSVNAKYSMAWKEWLDQRGREPIYKEEAISLHPPLFRISLVYGGQSFSGTGSRKKTAQHAAARKACEAFGILV